MNNPQAIPTSICAAGALLREVIQNQLHELEPLQRSKLQLALRPDCMSEAMKESLALAVREIHGFTQHTTANLFEAVLVDNYFFGVHTFCSLIRKVSAA